MDEADCPITLDEACRLYPGTKFTVSTLKAAADSGKLLVFRLGKRSYTTPAAMNEWVRLCQDESRRQGFTSIRNEGSGLSETDRVSSAQAALRASVGKLKSNSPSISGANTNRRAGLTR